MSGFVARRWTSPDGLVLHARDYAPAQGEAKAPVLCIPGLTRNAADFEHLAPRLAAEGRRVLALDLRGRGRSSWDPQPQRYVPVTYVADVLALMDQAGIGRAGFIGTSLGGVVTMILASMRPAAVVGAVLNDVGPVLGAAGLARIGGYVGQPRPARDWAEAAGHAAEINGFAFPAYGTEHWDRFARRLYEDAPEGGLRLAYDPAIAEPFKALDPDAPRPDLTPLFAALAAGRPTLVVRGALSDILEAEALQAMHEAAPELRAVEVAGVGHAPVLDEPEALAAIDAWLAELP